MCYHAREISQETGAFKNISSPERDIDENCAGNFIIANTNNKRNNSNRYQLGNTEPTNNCDSLQERRLRQLRRQADWQWLSACIGKMAISVLFWLKVFNFLTQPSQALLRIILVLWKRIYLAEVILVVL